MTGDTARIRSMHTRSMEVLYIVLHSSCLRQPAVVLVPQRAPQPRARFRLPWHSLALTSLLLSRVAGSQLDDNLGVLLLDFLDLYGRRLNHEEVRVR